MRVDKLLWFLRLAKTRSAAQAEVGSGHIRLNGRRVERPAQSVAVGDVLTLPLAQRVIVIAVERLPERRGPPLEAQSCYRVLDGQGDNPIAAVQTPATRGDPPP
jgi:ribosomal 50S subunit-recycling heat shock protein